jgi:hypothetical protein
MNFWQRVFHLVPEKVADERVSEAHAAVIRWFDRRSSYNAAHDLDGNFNIRAEDIELAREAFGVDS